MMALASNYGSFEIRVGYAARGLMLRKSSLPAIVTDRPIGATHDRLNGATCRPRKTGLEQVQFQPPFGVFATAGFGVPGVALGVR